MTTLLIVAVLALTAAHIIQGVRLGRMEARLQQFDGQDTKVKRPAVARTTRDSVVTLVSR